jgi:hypothetical protein
MEETEEENAKERKAKMKYREKGIRKRGKEKENCTYLPLQ